jgi:flagellar assembly protein FliH
MSDLWTAELQGDARRVDAWARPTQSTQFTPWSNADHPRRRASDFTPRAPTPHRDNTEIDLDALRTEAFTEGFERGREAYATEMADERAALADLIRSAKALCPEPHGPLATILAETVTRLVKQIVGEVTIDTEMLKARADSIAELITVEAGPARLRLHPDDIARLAGCEFSVPMAADHHLAPGTIVLETGEGWIEDGPQIRLARLRAQLDALGMPR